jgi:hypothetical protein
MSTLTKAIRFHFINLFNMQIVIAVAVLLFHLLLSITIIRLVATASTAGSNDVVVMVWIFVLGLVVFTPSFKYLLSQGMSRRRFFTSMSASIALLAAVFALLSTVFYAINLKVARVMMIYEFIYPSHNIFSILVWEFAALLFLGMLGWLIRLIYYQSDRNTKLIVTFAPFVAVSLLIFFNILFDGAMGHGIWDFLKVVMGFTFSIPNSFMGAANMTAVAAILGMPIWLLLRRAQIKD